MGDSEWLTVEEAMELTGASRATLSRWAAQRRVEFERRATGRAGQQRVMYLRASLLLASGGARDGRGAALVPAGASLPAVEVRQAAALAPLDSSGLIEALALRWLDVAGVPFVRVRQAAALSGLPVSFLAAAVRAGALPSLKAGRVAYVSVADLARLTAGRG